LARIEACRAEFAESAPVRFGRTWSKREIMAGFRLDQETRLTAALRGLTRFMTTER